MIYLNLIYPLFGFEDTNGKQVISRGRDSEDVLTHIICEFPRGSTLKEMDSLPINCNKLYDKNHNPGWLERIPDYLKIKGEK